MYKFKSKDRFYCFEFLGFIRDISQCGGSTHVTAAAQLSLDNLQSQQIAFVLDHL